MAQVNEISFFSFFIAKLNVAIPIEFITKALPLVELKFIPDLPESIIGLLNYQGDIYPVFDLRKSYGEDENEISLTDNIIIGEKKGFKFGILATKIIGNISGQPKVINDQNTIETEPSFSNKYIRNGNDIVYLSDPDIFLIEEEKILLSSILHEEKK